MTSTFSGGDPAVTQEPTNTPAPAGTTTSAPTLSAEELAILQKRLKDKDEFIETLKQERQHDRALLDSVTQKLDTLLATREVLEPITTPPAAVAPSISAEDLRKQGFLTVDDLKRAEQEKVMAQNFRTVVEAGRKQFGTKLDEVVEAKCKELGVTLEWAQAQAKTAPKVFLDLMGIKADKLDPTAPTGGDVRTPINPATPPTKPTSLMFGATSKEVLSAWKRAGEGLNK